MIRSRSKCPTCCGHPWLPRKSELRGDYERSVASCAPEDLAGKSRLRRVSLHAGTLYPERTPCLVFRKWPWNQVRQRHDLSAGNLRADAMDNAVAITWWAVDKCSFRYPDSDRTGNCRAVTMYLSRNWEASMILDDFYWSRRQVIMGGPRLALLRDLQWGLKP